MRRILYRLIAAEQVVIISLYCFYRGFDIVFLVLAAFKLIKIQQSHDRFCVTALSRLDSLSDRIPESTISFFCFILIVLVFELLLQARYLLLQFFRLHIFELVEFCGRSIKLLLIVVAISFSCFGFRLFRFDIFAVLSHYLVDDFLFQFQSFQKLSFHYVSFLAYDFLRLSPDLARCTHTPAAQLNFYITKDQPF
nr:MAG TPA: hypothetical protein [Caudoviricetes sp.]